MTVHLSPRVPGSRAAALVLGAAVVLLVAVRVLSAVVDLPASADVYRDVVRGMVRAPRWLGTGAEVVSEAGVVLLALVLCLVLWRAAARRDGGGAVGRTLLAGGAVVLAYGTSELAKLLLTQPRPCAASPLTTLAECPGDWSLPSNHATIVGALAVAALLTAPRWAVLTVPVALAVAAARVAVGVHYPHDVLTGLLWGGVVVAVLVLALGPLADRAGRRATRSLQARRPLRRRS